MAQELNRIKEHIKNKQNFLLSGGAGSGKTYTLVQAIKEIIKSKPFAKVACITYTNAAVREIEKRVNHNNLRVGTIHDFLWDCISNFQSELRSTIIELINAGVLNIRNSESTVDLSFFTKEGKVYPIQYKEYVRLKEGIISHDEVIKVANRMFKKYHKLRVIVACSYPFILIDEYQDTDPLVIEIFLEYFQNDTKLGPCFGFFGDSMQSIYDNGVGDLDKYKQIKGLLHEVKLVENRRSPTAVINLANKIRFDGLIQNPPNDNSAPNIVDSHPKTGKAVFYYSKSDLISIEDVRDYLSKKDGWTFDNTKKTKELNLTHKLIAKQAEFATLMEIHGGDQIIKYRDLVLNFVRKHRINTEQLTFGELLETLNTKVKPTTRIESFIQSNKELYEYALKLNFDDFVRNYVNTEQLIDDKKQEEDQENKKGSKRSELIRHLMKIEKCIDLYSSGDISAFLRVTEKQINKLSDRSVLSDSIYRLKNVGDKTVEEIIKVADELGIVKIDDRLERYSGLNAYIYHRIMQVPYREVQNLYKYLEGKTPFSTQHKTKGSEFDNVLVVLDNGNWNKYNFVKLFTEVKGEMLDSVTMRTRKIFYVCCTRAKENLAVYFHQPSETVLNKAREWFGESNVIEIKR